MSILVTAKQLKRSKNPLVRLGMYPLVQGLRTARVVKRVMTDSNYRSIIRLKLLNKQQVHQTSSTTSMDRYPILFTACRDYLNSSYPSQEPLKLLSFGCSTGEEVLSLRQYFPNARIVGAEINRRSLAICQSHPVDERISFIYSSPEEIKRHGPYDAVFCMAVMQRKPLDTARKGIRSLKPIYPFERFQEQIEQLDQLLRPGGLLIVHFTQYNVQDTSIADRYEPLGKYNQDDYKSPIFDRNSDIIDPPVSWNSIHIKRS
ncbi:hypothetical protein PCCS19_33430 [Paenibacillus sp. CCS19]|uniref:class I SAM-dependent methyltransferase n=1 Tax=Paenibacillus sp. CCS19 TaxID=3158387 RepID=UPI002568BBBE|nr:methyltransferase domain-containing protein [Paenibacillus cellulosilyticus]GMK40287.1 hypothetical protein PCCS19_33430 [Paenibacillus cellulosilyticus]